MGVVRSTPEKKKMNRPLIRAPVSLDNLQRTRRACVTSNHEWSGVTP